MNGSGWFRPWSQSITMSWNRKSWRNVVDTKLLDILVCPLCKGPLKYDKDRQELVCRGDGLAYPIRDGIPVMWVDQARSLEHYPEE